VDHTASPPPPDTDDALDEEVAPAAEADAPGEASEARGPHLPDRWPILVFVGLAIAAGWATYPNPPAWTPESFAAFILDLLPVVCAVLLPAALLLRHPDAPRVARPLFFGTLLFAAVPFLRLAGPALEGFFLSLTPPSEGVEWFVPSSILYGFFQSLIGLFGVLYIALGLSQARHWAFRQSARVAGFAVFAVGAAAALATIYSATQTDLSQIEMTTSLWAYLIGSIALTVITILTWAYLAMSLVRSTLSGEEPGPGWAAAALGASLVLTTFAIGAWANLVMTSNPDLNNVIFWVSNGAYSLGFLLLLIGFALGLPSLEPVEWAADDAGLDDEDEDVEDGLDEDDPVTPVPAPAAPGSSL
jgi:hypothetical protein